MRFSASLIICLLLFWTTTVQAQSTPEERAKEYSAAGLEAVDNGDFIGAVEAFKKAYRIDPKPKYLFNIGRAYHVMGNLRLALNHYERYLLENRSEKKAKRATEIIAELKRQMAVLTVTTNVPEATVSVDGDQEMCLQLTPCPLDPGEHFVEVTAAGYGKAKRRLRLEAGEQHTEDIELIAGKLPTRKGAIWRSALFPGMGQYYANHDTIAAVFLATELTAIAVAATGLSMEYYYYDKREKAPNKDYGLWTPYVDAFKWTKVAGYVLGGTVWAVNIVHAWAMPMPTKPTTTWHLMPTAGPNEAGMMFLFSF